MTSVFDEALFDVDAEGVDDGFVGSSQGEDCFCDGAIDFSFFNFVQIQGSQLSDRCCGVTS